MSAFDCCLQGDAIGLNEIRDWLGAWAFPEFCDRHLPQEKPTHLLRIHGFSLVGDCGSCGNAN